MVARLEAGAVTVDGVLSVDALTKRFGTVQALDDVGFTVERGQIVGFLGPNGAGKTTTMRAIVGLVTLDGGNVTWDGGPVTDAVRRRIGYMPAERGMYQRMRVRDHLTYYARLSGLPADEAGRVADRWLARLDLTERADDTVESLSSGNQQRVQLALALLGEPELLVLDEPFAGLDPLAVEVLSEILLEEVGRGTALLLSSHQLDLVADVAADVVIVDRGRVVLQGDVTDLRAGSAVRYVDVDFSEPVTWPAAGDGTARRHRVLVAVDADPGALLADARRHGAVVSYSFSPPDLSEVFREAVTSGAGR